MQNTTANSSALWQHSAHITDQLISPSCQTGESVNEIGSFLCVCLQFNTISNLVWYVGKLCMNCLLTKTVIMAQN